MSGRDDVVVGVEVLVAFFVVDAGAVPADDLERLPLEQPIGGPEQPLATLHQ